VVAWRLLWTSGRAERSTSQTRSMLGRPSAAAGTCERSRPRSTSTPPEVNAAASAPIASSGRFARRRSGRPGNSDPAGSGASGSCNLDEDLRAPSYRVGLHFSLAGLQSQSGGRSRPSYCSCTRTGQRWGPTRWAVFGGSVAGGRPHWRLPADAPCRCYRRHLVGGRSRIHRTRPVLLPCDYDRRGIWRPRSAEVTAYGL
jgi:hypothetical protein